MPPGTTWSMNSYKSRLCTSGSFRATASCSKFRKCSLWEENERTQLVNFYRGIRSTSQQISTTRITTSEPAYRSQHAILQHYFYQFTVDNIESGKTQTEIIHNHGKYRFNTKEQNWKEGCGSGTIRPAPSGFSALCRQDSDMFMLCVWWDYHYWLIVHIILFIHSNVSVISMFVLQSLRNSKMHKRQTVSLTYYWHNLVYGVIFANILLYKCYYCSIVSDRAWSWRNPRTSISVSPPML